MKKINELPEETRPIVERLIKQGCIISQEGSVELTDEMAYVLLILDRADVFN